MGTVGIPRLLHGWLKVTACWVLRDLTAEAGLGEPNGLAGGGGSVLN